MIKQKGQSLIEVLVALAMAVIIVSAIALLMVKTIDSSDFAKRQNQATQYAQEGIEIAKQETKGGTVELTDEILAAYIDPDGVEDIFDRTIVPGVDVDGCSPAALITVTVNWTDGKCVEDAGVPVKCHSVVLNSCVADGGIH